MVRGWVASTKKENTFSEAAIVDFNQKEINLKTLIHIHALTHKSTSNHSVRKNIVLQFIISRIFKKEKSEQIIANLQLDFKDKIITKIIPFHQFKPSSKEFQNYYKSNPNKPFCKNYMHPKLKILLEKFSKKVQKSKVLHLNSTI